MTRVERQAIGTFRLMQSTRSWPTPSQSIHRTARASIDRHRWRLYRDQLRHSGGWKHQGTRYGMKRVYFEAFASGDKRFGAVLVKPDQASDA
ncbi:MAG: hypothetical protein ACKVIQ_15580 [Acidimicrobiales bacterium]